MKKINTPTLSHQVAIRRRHRQSPRSSRRHRGEETVTQEVIPPFSPSIRVRPENARIDGIKLAVEFDTIGFDDSEEVVQFWRQLGGPKKEFKGTETAYVFSPLFRATPYDGIKASPLQFRERAGYYDNPEEKLNPPMIGGSVIGSRGTYDRGVFCRVRSNGPLSLNPSRAVNHRRVELLSAQPWRNALFENDKGTFLRGLDGNSNLCPRDLTQGEFRRAKRQYLLNVVSALNEEVRRAWHLGNGFPLVEMDGRESELGREIGVKRLSAQKVETYWESGAPDAVALVARLKPVLEAFWKESKTTDHGFEEAFRANAKTVTIHKDTGTTIRIYAKELNRLRIEVVHTPPKSPRLVPRYSADSVDGLLEITDALAVKAAEEVNGLLQFVEEWFRESPKELADSSEFLSRWFSQMGHEEDSLALLDVLRASGRVIGDNSLPDSLKEPLRKAVERGLLSKRRMIYLPKRDLTSEGNCASFRSHNRVTQHAVNETVTRSFSTPDFSGRRFPPSPPSRACAL
jgi:hypothetical protein